MHVSGSVRFRSFATPLAWASLAWALVVGCDEGAGGVTRVDPAEAERHEAEAAQDMDEPEDFAGTTGFAPIPDAVRVAREEFELLSEPHVGWSKLYPRSAFLPLDDPRGQSEEDFFGRLRLLFGEPTESVPGEVTSYVLRHRASDIVIRAYSAQSGPSYGGGVRRSGGLTGPEIVQQGQARIASDPELAGGSPVDWDAHIDAPPRELRRLRERERMYQRRVMDAMAPAGSPEVVARLDALLMSVSLP